MFPVTQSKGTNTDLRNQETTKTSEHPLSNVYRFSCLNQKFMVYKFHQEHTMFIHYIKKM